MNKTVASSGMTYGVGGAGSVPEASVMVDPVPGTKILLRRSDTQGKKPGSDDAEYGELFINYHSNTPMLCFKDNADTIVEIRPLTALELELGELTDVDTTGAANGMVLSYNGSTWVPVTAASLSVNVDLGYTPAADKGTVTNSAGDDAEIPLATGTNAGLTLNNYTTAEKDKLAGVEDGAEANVKPDWDATPGDDDEILNKPDLFSGDYDDLDNKPDLSVYLTDAPSDGSQYARKDGAWDVVTATGGASVSVGETPPADPAEGDLWWDSSDDSGRLYVSYEDGNTNQWVETSPSGGGGDVDGLIATGSNPPEPATSENEGLLWYNENDGQLYISYTDADSSQWINASPSGGGGGGGGDTYWDKNGNVLSPKDVADNIEIGGGDITLNADGSASFTDSVTAGNSAKTSHAIIAESTGRSPSTIVALNYDSQGKVFAGRDISVANTDTSSIFADGSASFAGEVDIGNRDTSSASGSGHRLYTDATYSALFTQASSGAADSTTVYRVDKGTDTQKIKFTADGSAKFAGTVEQNATITRSVVIETEPDNPANYTVTTDVDEDGNETENRVYNGPTLDVKETLTTLLSRIAQLEATVASLEGGTN